MAHLKYLYSTKCLSEGQLHAKLQRLNRKILSHLSAGEHCPPHTWASPGCAPTHLTCSPLLERDKDSHTEMPNLLLFPRYLHQAAKTDLPRMEISYSASTPHTLKVSEALISSNWNSLNIEEQHHLRMSKNQSQKAFEWCDGWSWKPYY